MNEEMNTNIEQETELQQGKEKMFTQSQLEEIISKRLERERKIGESLHEVKKVLLDAKNEGLIKGTSFAEMARELMQITRQGEELKNDDTAEEKNPKPCDITPSFAEEGGNVNTPEAVENNTKQERVEGDFFSELKAIKQKHKSTDAEQLMAGDLFEKFAKGRSGRASEIFDDFILFMQGLGFSGHEENKAEQSIIDPYSSTAFSGFSDTESTYSGLTKQQMEMAKSAGLSYREYASILAGIPQKKNKNNL